MIAVHVGAGFHSHTKLPTYKHVCQDACKAAIALLHEGGSATQAITLAVSILENSSITNAGLGSNLTEQGTVECDACMMNDELKFGACGAVERVKNPIKLANAILEKQYSPQILGRVPPCVLVGKGAEDYASVELCENDDLKTASATHSYNKYMSRVRSVQNGLNKSEKKLNGQLNVEVADNDLNALDGAIEFDLVDSVDEEIDEDGISDTVGAVCVDLEGRLAAGASSGGILLKHPGRIGPAAMFGCGCWAESKESSGVAIAASGCGEQLMQTLLVRECARNVFNNQSDVPSAVQLSLTDFLCNECERNAGLLVLAKDEESYELVWSHSTQTMVLAYASHVCEKPSVVVSRNSGKPGYSNILSGVRVARSS